MKQYQPLSTIIPLSAPLAMFLEFTNRCNFKCSFCPESLPDYSDKAGGIHRLSWELFRKICADIKALGTLDVLRFYGLGETLLHPNAPAMITEACSMGLARRTDMTSNGSRLTGSIAEALHISIYGTTAAEMNDFTRSPISPETIRSNMIQFLKLRGERTKPLLIAKISTGSREAEDRFRQMFSGAADQLEVVPIHNWTGQEALVQLGRIHTRAVCPSPFYQLKINSDGLVTCCATDWERDTAVGDVGNESLSSIWHGERMKSFRLMHLNHRRCDNAACAGCDFIDSFHDDLDSVSPEVLG